MQVLYKDEEGFLAVMEVTKAAYIEDEELMEICGPEEDIAVAIDAKLWIPSAACHGKCTDKWKNIWCIHSRRRDPGQERLAVL